MPDAARSYSGSRPSAVGVFSSAPVSCLAFLEAPALFVLYAISVAIDPVQKNVSSKTLIVLISLGVVRTQRTMMSFHGHLTLTDS